MSDYVLDTSALLAYIENEEGADEIETLHKDPEFEQLEEVEQLILKYKKPAP